MITSKEKSKVHKVLGKHYTGKILKFFAVINIVNSKNEPYTSNDIRRIVNGFLELPEIEYKILQFVKHEEKKQLKQLEKRKLLISKK